MKSTPYPGPVSCAIAVVALFLNVPAVFAEGEGGGEGEMRKRVKSLERELERSRDKLHEAQRELAAKAERIEELERDLEKRREGRGKLPKKDRQASDEKERGGTPSKRAPSPPEPGIPVGPAKEEGPLKPPASAPSFVVSYSVSSAANYKEREDALAWAKEQLRANPGSRLRFEGRANDSKFSEVNRLIASNRARYLADFLRLSGIPASSIGEVSGAISREDDTKGRRCEITLETGENPAGR